MQNQFFFVIHLYDPNRGAFELPLYIETSSSIRANKIARILLKKISAVLQVVGRPSKPVRVFRHINQHRFNVFFSNLNSAINANSVVTINLPVAWSRNPFTQGGQNPVIQTQVYARITVPGPHSQFYAL